MSNEFTLTLNSPITEAQWDAITDVDFEHTNEITFHTKHGKEVKFVKASAQPEQRTLTEDDYAYCTECDHVEMCRWYPMYGCEFKSRPSAQSDLQECEKCIFKPFKQFQPERKKGRWIDLDDHVMCSCCGATHYGADKNYCPNCGADCRGENNG